MMTPAVGNTPDVGDNQGKLLSTGTSQVQRTINPTHYPTPGGTRIIAIPAIDAIYRPAGTMQALQTKNTLRSTRAFGAPGARAIPCVKAGASRFENVDMQPADVSLLYT